MHTISARTILSRANAMSAAAASRREQCRLFSGQQQKPSSAAPFANSFFASCARVTMGPSSASHANANAASTSLNSNAQQTSICEQKKNQQKSTPTTHCAATAAAGGGVECCGGGYDFANVDHYVPPTAAAMAKMMNTSIHRSSSVPSLMHCGGGNEGGAPVLLSSSLTGAGPAGGPFIAANGYIFGSAAEHRRAVSGGGSGVPSNAAVFRQPLPAMTAVRHQKTINNNGSFSASTMAVKTAVFSPSTDPHSELFCTNAAIASALSATRAARVRRGGGASALGAVLAPSVRAAVATKVEEVPSSASAAPVAQPESASASTASVSSSSSPQQQQQPKQLQQVPRHRRNFSAPTAAAGAIRRPTSLAKQMAIVAAAAAEKQRRVDAIRGRAVAASVAAAAKEANSAVAAAVDGASKGTVRMAC